MKTLDEVIKANECCDHGEPDSRCEDCPYNGIGACCAERESDALHYLREYKERIKTLRYWNEKAISEQQNLVDAYMLYKITLENGKDNPALTWDELRQMEGKPVWIWLSPRIKNTPGSGRWEIIYKFNPIGGNKNLFEMEMESRSRFRRKYQGDLWQAYRKERE